jgi:hypothetical protein
MNEYCGRTERSSITSGSISILFQTLYPYQNTCLKQLSKMDDTLMEATTAFDHYK